MMMNKLYFSVFLTLLSIAILPLLNLFLTNQFNFESSVWCIREKNQTKLCKFKNICYDPQFKALLFFLNKNTVIKGLNHYADMQKIQLSSVLQHNQFYANISLIDTEHYKLTKKLKIINFKTLLMSRFKPNNIMHVIHDDLFPMFLTLEYICFGDLHCMEDYGLLFHDNHLEGPFFYLITLFSRHLPVILNKLDLNSSFILCFKEMVTGLVTDSVVYQYGFGQPHGPIKPPYLTQNDVFRFTSFLKGKLLKNGSIKNVYEVILFERKKNRKILNVAEVKEMIENVYMNLQKKIKVNVINLDLFSNNLSTLISKISQANGLIGMHGAEMILSLFLKPNSFVIEIFPFGINPAVVSFIKPFSELQGSNFIHFAWRNIQKNNSVAHPDAHPLFGGISYLDELTQNKIKSAYEVPAFECCNNPFFLYHMYQDTKISFEFRKFLHESLEKTLTCDKEPGKVTKSWFHPYAVFNVSCTFHFDKRILFVKWHPPFNIINKIDLLYSVYIKEEIGSFTKNISTDQTILEIEVPVRVSHKLDVWIYAYLKSNNFQSPDLYIKCLVV